MHPNEVKVGTTSYMFKICTSFWFYSFLNIMSNVGGNPNIHIKMKTCRKMHKFDWYWSVASSGPMETLRKLCPAPFQVFAEAPPTAMVPGS
jgi:hypothetical protein